LGGDSNVERLCGDKHTIIRTQLKRGKRRKLCKTRYGSKDGRADAIGVGRKSVKLSICEGREKREATRGSSNSRSA
jgi:hypothetical protein